MVVGVLALVIALQTAEAPRVIENPAWLTPPDISRAPSFATFLELKGRVTLSCDLQLDGSLDGCSVVSAIPEGAGFEAVALAAIQSAVARPRHEDGRAVAGRITTSFTFGAVSGSAADMPETPEESLVLARSITARAPANFSNIPMFEVDVAADRQAEVRSWISELKPELDALYRERDAHFIVQTMTLEQLQDRVAGRPLRTPLGNPEILAFTGPELIAFKDELRRRYCAQYDCRQPGLVEVDEP